MIVTDGDFYQWLYMLLLLPSLASHSVVVLDESPRPCLCPRTLSPWKFLTTAFCKQYDYDGRESPMPINIKLMRMTTYLLNVMIYWVWRKISCDYRFDHLHAV